MTEIKCPVCTTIMIEQSGNTYGKYTHICPKCRHTSYIEEDNKGCPISIAWDKENGIDWINIRDAEGKILMKVHKNIWDGISPDCGFTAGMRDSILQQIMKVCG